MTDDPTEIEARRDMATDLLDIIIALNKFLSGEVRQGVVTVWKMPLVVQAQTLKAMTERALTDLPNTKMRRE